MDNLIQLHPINDEARVDSRLLAEHLQNQHKNVLAIIDQYLPDFEELGRVAFKTQTQKTKGGRQKQRIALLNEDQSYLLLSYSRNTLHVRRLKIELVKAFSRFRQHRQLEADYLPFYHEYHDEVKELANRAQQAGSNTNERIFHINFNRLINDAFGLPSGQRQNLPGHLRAKVTAANVIASELLKDAIDSGMTHKQAYQHVKQGVMVFAHLCAKRLEAA